VWAADLKEMAPKEALCEERHNDSVPNSSPVHKLSNFCSAYHININIPSFPSIAQNFKNKERASFFLLHLP
jgi:hypothetical protein